MNISHSTAQSELGTIELYTIKNNSGASVSLSSLGAGIIDVVVPDSQGRLGHVALRYADPASYLNDGPCLGKTPGRYANRIARGRFSIDGKPYQLNINNGPNALHGGPTGFQNRLWESEADPQAGTVTFRRVSEDGEENYPGRLSVAVRYRLTDDDVLSIDYEATVDGSATVINLTNHTYWNLDGHGSALAHQLMLNADRYLVTDKDLTPTGELAPVDSTPMDFRNPRTIGRDIAKNDFDPIRFGKGYDSCWVIANHLPGKLAYAARLIGPSSGRVLDVYTTQPGVQVYTGNWLDGSPDGPEGHRFKDYDGVAIECQNFPDAPNHVGFPTALLRPGDKYRQTIEFRFTTF